MSLIDELLAAPPRERVLCIPKPRIEVPNVPIGAAIAQVARAEAEEKRRYRQRPWFAAPHYSKLMGRGMVLNADGFIERFVDDEWQPNALTNDGQAEFINVELRGTAQSAGYYLGLTVLAGATTAIPSKTATSANLTQTALGGGSTVTEAQVAAGYARQQILQAAWGAPALNSGDQQTGAAQKTFGPASAAWSGTTTQPAQVAYAILISTASGASGTWVLWIALSAATSIAISQSFAYTLSLKVT